MRTFLKGLVSLGLVGLVACTAIVTSDEPVQCNTDADCGGGNNKCDHNTTPGQCVTRKELGETCSGDQECNGDLTGTQRIGWDPSTRQIRSWEFDSDGSFGEGIWNRRSDESWVIKMSGVRHDGRIASDTRIVTRTGADQLSWRAVDRTLSGAVQEDSPEFAMVRRAPAPGEARIKRATQ